jgi:BetR domain
MELNEKAPIRSTNPCAIVSDLLTRNGVPEDAWGSTLASIIGGHYQTAKRRLASQETFSLEELLQIASHFNTNVASMLRATYPEERIVPGARQASLQMGDGSVECQVVTRPTNQSQSNGLIAFEVEGKWHIRHTSDAPTAGPLHVVLSLHMEAADSQAPSVAIVDDEAPTTLVRYLKQIRLRSHPLH